MNKIYLEISKLSDKFRTMCYGLTQDKDQVEDARGARVHALFSSDESRQFKKNI